MMWQSLFFFLPQPFEGDATAHLDFGTENLLVVAVNNTLTQDTVPQGRVSGFFKKKEMGNLITVCCSTCGSPSPTCTQPDTLSSSTTLTS